MKYKSRSIYCQTIWAAINSTFRDWEESTRQWDRRTSSASGSLLIWRYNQVKGAFLKRLCRSWRTRWTGKSGAAVTQNVWNSHRFFVAYPPHWDIDREKDAGRKKLSEAIIKTAGNVDIGLNLGRKYCNRYPKRSHLSKRSINAIPFVHFNEISTACCCLCCHPNHVLRLFVEARVFLRLACEGRRHIDIILGYLLHHPRLPSTAQTKTNVVKTKI